MEQYPRTILSALSTTPILSLSSVGQICHSPDNRNPQCFQKQVFFYFGSKYPNQVLFAYTIQRFVKSIDIEETSQQEMTVLETMKQLVNGYGTLTQVGAIKMQKDHNGLSLNKFKRLTPLAIFHSDLELADVIKVFKRSRPDKRSHSISKQYKPLVRNANPSKTNRPEFKKTKEEKTAQKKKETVKVAPSLPRLNSKGGKKIESKGKLLVKFSSSASEQEYQSEGEANGKNVASQQEKSVKEGSTKKDIEFEEMDDEEAMFVEMMEKKNQTQSKPENLNSNIPKSQSQPDTSKLPLSKQLNKTMDKEPKKGQTTLFAFIKNK